MTNYLSWLDAYTGSHKQLFDFGHANISEESHLVVVRNYLNAHKEVFDLEHPRVNTIVGIAARAYPLNASDALWEKYSIGVHLVPAHTMLVGLAQEHGFTYEAM